MELIGRWDWPVAAVLTALVTLAAACSDDDSASPPSTTSTNPAMQAASDGAGGPAVPVNVDEVVIPAPAGAEFAVLQDALPSPVPYDGEPSRSYSGDLLGDSGANGTTAWMQIKLGSDWHHRDSLTFCSWTARRGFHDCRAMGVIPGDRPFVLGIDVPAGDEQIEWWLMADDDASAGGRRLFALPAEPVEREYELAPGFETVADVLTKPPPEGGNYLVPGDSTTWEWSVEGPDPVPRASAELVLGRVDGVVHVAPPAVETGVVSSYGPTEFERAEVDESLAPIVLTLRSCRYTAPGRLLFEGEFEAPPDLELPVTLPLTMTVWAGDVGGGGTVDATFEASGQFAVPLDRAVPRDGGETRKTWGSSIHDSVGRTCELESAARRPVEATGRPETVVDYEPLVVVAPAGTVESLARLGDTADQEGPMTPLARLLLDPGWSGLDRLWIDPTGVIDGISVENEGSCVTVRTTYVEPSGTVTQRRGCSQLTRLDGQSRVLGLFDGAWDVTVTGPSAETTDDLAARLAVLPFANVDPIVATDSSFDPDAFLAAFVVDHPDFEEHGRIPWRDGHVVVSFGVDDRGRMTTWVVEAFSGGREWTTGTGCVDWVFHDATNDDGPGYAISAAAVDGGSIDFMFRDEPYSAMLDRRTEIDGSVVSWGFVELPRDRINWGTLSNYVVFDASGAEVPCEQ